MDMLLNVGHTLFAFFIVLSAIVFVHEFGHFIVAKWCGVKIEAYAIGFGKELIGRTDRTGTRWKICALPLGGYVKMYGDASAASAADEEAMEKMTDAEKALTFHHKPLPKKAAIVAAGPMANFLLTIAIFTFFILTIGLPSVKPIVGQILPGSAAEDAGLQVGDVITQVNNDTVKNFNDIPYLISTNLGTPVTLHILRKEQPIEIVLIPKEVEDDDGLGNTIKRPLIGIKSMDIKYKEVGLPQALSEAVRRTYMICETTIRVVGQIATGKRGAHDLRGPVGIAQISGQAAQKDLHTVLWLIAMLSANLGLVNLFPIPLLDGGHLAFYTAEALRGRPLAEKVQEYGFKLGFILLFALMAFTLFNDVRRLF